MVMHAEEKKLEVIHYLSVHGKDFLGRNKNLTGVKIPQLGPSWAIDMLYDDFIQIGDATVILCGSWSVWSTRKAKEHGKIGPVVASSVKWTVEVMVDLSNAVKRR